MFDHKTISHFLKRTVLHAAKWPALYLILGMILIALADIDKIFPITKWKNIFDLTDKIGNVFIALAITSFIYHFIVLLSEHYERRFAHDQKIAAVILATLRKGLRIIFILVVLNIIITILAPSKMYLLVANNVINAIIIGSIGWIAIQIFYTVEVVIYQNMISGSSTQNLRAVALYTKTHIIRNIVTVVIVIITAAAILMSFSSFRNIGISILASAGFLTAIIGLAGQKTLFSLFSGLQIALSQLLKIGDVVVIENMSGIIEEITFTYVTLRLGDRRRLVVPITYFIDKPFENWSHEGHSLRSSLHFFIDYMLPIAPLRTELDNILKASAYWDGTASKLQVANLTERAVEIRVQVSAANADNLSDLRAEVREKILNFIRENYPDHFPKLRCEQ